MDVKKELAELLEQKGKSLANCTDQDLYYALLTLTQQVLKGSDTPRTGRKLYYISAEFLIGKLLSNNLLNLGLYDEVKRVLAEAGRDLRQVESFEPEPSLGNGGLGRLAACFLDSIASLGLQGDGVGLNYHYGLFRQVFDQNRQQEEPNPWLEDQSWLTDTGIRFKVPFGGNQELESVLYDLNVPGYENGVVNKLHLFDVAQPAPAPAQGISFDKGDIAHCLTSFLYPDDSDEAGKLLRVYQQYFMVCSAVQLILRDAQEKGWPLKRLNQHAVIQINDTHPSMVIPELIRQLLAREELGLNMDEAIYVASNVCAYTNHTILAEALETWPSSYLEQVAPQLMPIIRELDRRMKDKYADPRVAIIDGNDCVHMAHMDIHYGFSVNGVAALHTEILKNTELKPFYDIYPGKFNNKTNGVTFRRWLMACNPALADLITQCIGEGWKREPAQLERLLPFRKDAQVLDRLLEIKAGNKNRLSGYLSKTQGISLDPGSIFDIQVKRLHEYKRQQMNALYAIHQYQRIKAGYTPARPITVIFGAKAAPAYVMAKNIIHLILCLQQLINRDPQVSPWMKIVMVENYNVTLAEELIPAADLSEQISLASKEASGTSNMKFMANGALTIGTLDGANVEIADLVGEGNIYLFGALSDQVIDLYARNGYHPDQLYAASNMIRTAVDFITGPELSAIGDLDQLQAIQQDLKNKDYFMALLDVRDYAKVKDQALWDYEDRRDWAAKSLVNIAKSGFFSSDRTIQEYNRDIWHL